jgi:cysteinyl-tRNA synthetase
MEKGSQREGKSVWEIAEYYTKIFLEDAELLNFLPPTKYTKATDYIQEQIEMVKCLTDKDFTYTTSDGIYFDTSKLADYGKLVRSAGVDAEGLEEGKRVQFSDEKRNKTDFALWKFSPKDEKRQMEWDSPWGKGFPGWHIECSAMSKKFLGDTFDIHCGGIDHIPIHHTNEIAQSEACNGKPFVHYWLHGAFLEEEGEGKMSKSKDEFLRVKTLTDRGYSPMDYRYLCLGTHYRKRLLFSWEGLDAAKSALTRLRSRIIEFKNADSSISSQDDSALNKYKQEFLESINDDLNMPQALAVTWGVVRDESLSDSAKLSLLYNFDKVLGLDLSQQSETKNEVPEQVMSMVNQRIEAKKTKDFKLADELRNKIKELGYEIVDKKDGAEVKAIKN